MTKRMKLLIAYDGSIHSDAAIADLQRAGLPNVLDAVIVSVEDEPLVAPLPAEGLAGARVGEKAISIANHADKQISKALQEANKLVQRASKLLKSNFPGWHVRSEILAGTPAPELIRKADEMKADLLVVGSQGRTAIGRLILGSVSMEVASDARCSVRIGRPSAPKERTALRILIGLDGSPQAERAVRKVLMRPWPEGTELRIVAVDDGVSPVKTAAISESGESTSFRANKIIKLAATKGLTVSAGIHEGDPESVLIEEASEWEADCIIIGSRRARKKAEGFFASSVLTGLAANAECSIEIVR